MKPFHIFYLTSVLFLVIIAHLFKMQVLDHEHYRRLSERNRIRPVVLEAPRGVVTDRYGRELASNRLAFDCYIIPQEGRSYLGNTLGRLAGITGVSEEELEGRYRRRKKGAFTPVLLAEDIDKETALRVEEASDEMPGVFIKTRPIREYFLGEDAAHLLGYIGLLDPDEYRELKDYGYQMNDTVGKAGLEKFYESYLKGKDGAVQYEADSRGRLLRVLSIQEPVDGKPLKLTVDKDLQTQVSHFLKAETGAVVVMELETGGILALANSPAYDPNDFLKPAGERASIRGIFSDPRKPLLNRAITGEYPPGSTFKMITSHAALRTGKIDASTRFFCPGFFMLGRHRFKCWQHDGHGTQGLLDAIQHSCNVFFFNTGMRLDVNLLSEEAREFGLGQRTLVDLPGEREGLVPSREWKRAFMRRDPEWYRGETAIFAIGQGYLLVTPIQMLRVGATVASGGYWFRPHAVEKIGDVNVAPHPQKKSWFHEEHLATIREGMRRVVQSDTGTGQRARSELVPVAGKTGTAQATGYEDHAWFVGFAPSSGKASAAIVVFLEHGGHGGLSAAAIAGRTFTWMAEHGYFR